MGVPETATLAKSRRWISPRASQCVPSASRAGTATVSVRGAPSLPTGASPRPLARRTGHRLLRPGGRWTYQAPAVRPPLAPRSATATGSPRPPCLSGPGSSSRALETGSGLAQLPKCSRPPPLYPVRLQPSQPRPYTGPTTGRTGPGVPGGAGRGKHVQHHQGHDRALLGRAARSLSGTALRRAGVTFRRLPGLLRGRPGVLRVFSAFSQAENRR